MNTIDPDVRRAFDKLGIEPGKATYYPPGLRPKKTWSEATDSVLLTVLKHWGPETFPSALQEIRKRKLLPESEIRLWLGLDPD